MFEKPVLAVRTGGMRGCCLFPLSRAPLVSSLVVVGGVQEVNTVEAIWMKSPSEVDDAKYNEFYKFIAKAYDEPLAKVRLAQCA